MQARPKTPKVCHIFAPRIERRPSVRSPAHLSPIIEMTGEHALRDVPIAYAGLLGPPPCRRRAEVDDRSRNQFKARHRSRNKADRAGSLHGEPVANEN